MENTFWTAMGASSLAAIVTTIGIYVIRRFEDWRRKNTIYFICFAAGVLISVLFLHIIPKAFSMNANASIYLFSGYISLHLFNRFINVFVCDKNTDNEPLLGAYWHFRPVPLYTWGRPSPVPKPWGLANSMVILSPWRRLSPC